jgi:hypothetical protein
LFNIGFAEVKERITSDLRQDPRVINPPHDRRWAITEHLLIAVRVNEFE